MWTLDQINSEKKKKKIPKSKIQNPKIENLPEDRKPSTVFIISFINNPLVSMTSVENITVNTVTTVVTLIFHKETHKHKGSKGA